MIVCYNYEGTMWVMSATVFTTIPCANNIIVSLINTVTHK